MWTYTTDSMDFVTVSTGLILPYWMGLPIRYIQIIEENEFKLLSIEVIYMNAKDMGVFICKLRKENNMKQME